MSMSNNERVIVYDANGQAVQFLVDAGGNSLLAVGGFEVNDTDNVGTTTFGSIKSNSVNFLFNGNSFDRERNNTNETLLASAARTAAVNSADFVNYNARGIHVITDISALTATGQITVTLEGKDPISGNYYDLLIGATLTATGTSVLKLYPGITASANASASDILPRDFRVSVAVANAVSITYSIAGVLVV